MLRPINDRVIVKVLNPRFSEKKTDSGIIYKEDASDDQILYGEVVAVSSKVDTVTEGEKVGFNMFFGQSVKVEEDPNQEYRAIQEHEIMFVVEDDSALTA